MAFFFRKLRLKTFSNEKIGNYFKYAIGEIILVVIGILIAIQINNLNEHKKQKQQEKLYLTELRKSLENDLNEEFIPAISKYAKLVERHEKLNDFYYSEEVFANDSLSQYFKSCLTPEWDFVFNTATFENIKSVGINMISNDSLRSKLSYLYSYSYANIREVNQNYIRYYDLQMSPLIFDHININDSPLSSEDLNYLRSSIQISNRLRHLKRNRSFLYYQLLLPTQEIVETVISDINVELQKFEE
ncbi:MAG: DUF6090 family protein [Bacteroidota bacterium]